MADYWVYILTNQPRSTLYVGVTNDLVRRIHEHREGLVSGFTKRYKLKILVYFEQFDCRRQQFNVRRISNTGRAFGNSNSLNLRIRSGAISSRISPDERLPHRRHCRA
jgi:putative endonuclease